MAEHEWRWSAGPRGGVGDFRCVNCGADPGSFRSEMPCVGPEPSAPLVKPADLEKLHSCDPETRDTAIEAGCDACMALWRTGIHPVQLADKAKQERIAENERLRQAVEALNEFDMRYHPKTGRFPLDEFCMIAAPRLPHAIKAGDLRSALIDAANSLKRTGHG